jgi:AraC family transcriptional regulator of adaptative response/methylated-DNA-[protein]-cysteine methyltransferase
VEARDARLDGLFVYGVRSTGIFCRPTCPSRRPSRGNVLFFASAGAAERAGFRPCKRCSPTLPPHAHLSALVERVCDLINANPEAAPSLAALGAAVGLSPAHLQRSFKQATGITPRQYAAALRLGRFKEKVRAGEPIAAAAYGAGFGSSSRLYAQAGRELGMTPSAYQRGGAGQVIGYTLAGTPFGRLLLAATERGVCAVSLGSADDELVAELEAEFPAAELRRDDAAPRAWLEAVLANLAGEVPPVPLPLDVAATAFQQRVWAALQQIPYGATRTYAEVAEAIGAPKAVRAVAHACATNPVATVIPCHRVVRSDGGLGGYRWGIERKRQLLEAEKEVRG